MSECAWPQYESHKVVQAARIVGIARDDDDNIVLWVRPDGDDTRDLERFDTTVKAMMAQAMVGGYAMRYPDGFKSVSPEKAFEEGYTRIP